MKRFFLILTTLTISLITGAQDFIDNVFNKYSGKENITSIVVSKDLLDFAFAMDSSNKLNKLKGVISDLKILVLENRNDNSIGLTSEVRNNLDSNKFLSLIEILDGKNKVNFYVKKEGDKIVHLLLLAKDDDEDVLLSLKGQISLKELAEIGRTADVHGSFHHLSYLKNIEEK